MKYLLNERLEPGVRVQIFKLWLDVEKNEEVIGFLVGFFQPGEGLLVVAKYRVYSGHGRGWRGMFCV